jgi:hypothetical protein
MMRFKRSISSFRSWGTRRAKGWIGILFLAITACSPYNFQKEVTAVSTSVSQLSDGFTTGYTQLAADRAAQLDLTLTSTRSKVVMSSSCLVPVSPTNQNPCTIYQFRGAAPALTTIEQKRAQTMAALSVVQGYAQALSAVTNATDRATYDSAVGQLSSAVGTLAKAAGPVAPELSTIAPAGVNLVGWLVGTALDEQRLDSLKAGVTAASTPLPNGAVPFDYVVSVLGDGLFALSQQRQAVLIAEENILIDRLGPSLNEAAYTQGLSSAHAVVSVLDGLRQANPTAATAALVKAHQALLAALNDPSRNYPSLVTAVGALADQVGALQSALTAPTTQKTAAPTKGK